MIAYPNNPFQSSSHDCSGQNRHFVFNWSWRSWERLTRFIFEELHFLDRKGPFDDELSP